MSRPHVPLYALLNLVSDATELFPTNEDVTYWQDAFRSHYRRLAKMKGRPAAHEYIRASFNVLAQAHYGLFSTDPDGDLPPCYRDEEH